MTRAKLFQPLDIRGSEFKNRAWVSPMCQYSADSGFISEWHRIHLGAFATGGAGLIMVEASGVTPEGRISPSCPGIWSDEHVAKFRPIIDFAHIMGAKIGIQLAHAGRKASTYEPWNGTGSVPIEEHGWETVAPSAIPFGSYATPRALTQSQIGELVEAFASAAKRVVEAGFDVVEIHAAHGYLLHQFLSPLSNLRDDEYGGDFDGRTRLLLEVASAVREAISADTPLFVRISATDWVEGGWDLPQSIEIAKRLKVVGVDLMDISSGGLVHDAKIPFGPNYQVPFASAIRQEADIMTSAVGLITKPEQAEEIIVSGEADAVMLARAFLRDPHWALNAAEALGVKIAWPKQFDRARTV
ncbi:MAG TPA: NADH:flavin oxidoreductase/NADH oxidase [Candidatus Nanopelagicaceae bacterium]|nr:NADH:flavin oxidoreductase/NADH oxidase [Candidatus Nanopelagicaceae bacterium]